MSLADKLSQATRSAPETANPGGSLLGGAPRRRKDGAGDNSRRLKVRVHNRLFETIDVSKLETLDPQVVSGKVTAAINDILNEEGRLLTDRSVEAGRGDQERAARARSAGTVAPR